MSCVNSETSEAVDRLSEKTSEHTSRCTSLEELMFMTDAGTSPSFTFDRDSIEDIERQSARGGSYYSNSPHSSPSTTTTTDSLPPVNNQNANFISFDDWSAPHPTNPNRETSHPNKHWVSELGVASNQPGSDPSNTSPGDIFGDASLGTRSLLTNPFLQEEVTPAAPSGISSTGDLNFFAFQATTMPTFSVRNPNAVFVTTDDPFASSFDAVPDSQLGQGSPNQQRLFYEQQQWLRNQSKIIERHMT
ncbi:hypothetical protein MLD38_025784 [Melastoma candidum]|nr:hypothetical protein MLD38_025784 [Melastoma candidum]